MVSVCRFALSYFVLKAMFVSWRNFFVSAEYFATPTNVLRCLCRGEIFSFQLSALLCPLMSSDVAITVGEGLPPVKLKQFKTLQNSFLYIEHRSGVYVCLQSKRFSTKKCHLFREIQL